MRTSARWVRHTATKRPITVEGWPASVTDPSTWSTFEQASDSTDGAGLGWVLGEGVGCIDIDHCIDASGNLEQWAQSVVDEHRDDALLVEVSRSGTGVHIFLPMEQGRGRIEDHQGHRVEVYPPNSGRYIAVTGDRLE